MVLKQWVRQRLRRTFYRYGWDTRCRNLLATHAIGPYLQRAKFSDKPVLLDVGSGCYGLAAFTSGVPVLLTDLTEPDEPVTEAPFQTADVTALPFTDCSFPVVSCLDVLEHLSLAQREQAVREVVRVADHALLIGCPHGATAQACDEDFRQACIRNSKPLQSWIGEHQKQAYPEEAWLIERVQQAAQRTGREAKITVRFNEPARICRRVRNAAARSTAGYVLVNLLYGMLLPLVRKPRRDNSYRIFIVAELSPQKT
jgi:hypothetical protein